MFNIKKIIAITTCAVLCAAPLCSCGKKEKENTDDFSVSAIERDPAVSNNSTVSNPDAADREFEETLGVIAEEYDYYGLKYTVNRVSELKFDQYPDGKVLIVDLTLTNESEYTYTVGAYTNFDVKVNGEGETPDFVTAQVMTIVSRYFENQNIESEIFGSGKTPPVQPGETLSGYLPIALTSNIAEFDTITLSFIPDIESGVYSNITVDITPADVTPFS